MWLSQNDVDLELKEEFWVWEIAKELFVIVKKKISLFPLFFFGCVFRIRVLLYMRVF